MPFQWGDLLLKYQTSETGFKQKRKCLNFVAQNDLKFLAGFVDQFGYISVVRSQVAQPLKYLASR